MIIDAIDWLIPKPKGRILFDLSHNPIYELDSYTNYQNYLVSRGYNFDLLYPSSNGNLTSANIANYDLLFMALPRINFTSSEITDINTWVNNGGGLLVCGEREGISFNDYLKNINRLISVHNMEINLTVGTSGSTLSNFETHPTSEKCSSISLPSHGYMNYSASAFPLWYETSHQTAIVGDEYGNGRIVCIPDVDIFTNNYIGVLDNKQYAINLANWLTSDDANILLYTDYPTENYYDSSVVSALNEMGVSYQLTCDIDYFNLSLNLRSWDLVIFNNPYIATNQIFDEILEYCKAGGNLIISTYRYLSFFGNVLWDYAGFEYGGNTLHEQPDIYLWESESLIFNYPVDYKSMIITDDESLPFGITYCNLMAHDNGTKIAGISSYVQDDNNAIIIGANGHIITNGMLLSVYNQDTDDSTYSDGLELWINEISYFILPPLAPTLITPNSEIFSNQIDIQWSDIENANNYNIYIDGVLNYSTINTDYIIEFQESGEYTVAITALNSQGESVFSNSIIISVELQTSTTTNTSTTTDTGTNTNTGSESDGLLDSLSNTNTLILMGISAGIAGLLIAITGFIIKKKRSKVSFIHPFFLIFFNFFILSFF